MRLIWLLVTIGTMTPIEKDDQLGALTREIIEALDSVNGGVHPGFRPAHAKGIMCSGTFTPAAGAISLTRAPHVQRASTAVTVRFSDFTGIPTIADNDPNANPKGIAMRFHLDAESGTDIVGHSVDGFPVRNGEDFVAFFRAIAASGPKAAKPTPIEQFLASHPAALEFIQKPKPFPSSFAKESFFGVNAFKFTNREGVVKFGRYRIRPEGGNEYLSAEAAAGKSASYLFDEIKDRLMRGTARLNIVVQIAEEGDTTDDATVHWPESRTQVAFGMVELARILPDSDGVQHETIFDPVPKVDGIETSGDPLPKLRSAAYLMSGRRRKQA